MRTAACLHDFGDEKREQHSRQVSALQVLECGTLETGTGVWASSLQGHSVHFVTGAGAVSM